MHSRHLCGELCSPSLRVKHLHILCGTLLHVIRVSSLSFNKLFNHLCVSVWAPGHLLYSLNYNPIILIFLLTLVQLGPWELRASLTYSH